MGKDLSHTFSKSYFIDKFKLPIWEGWSYDNVELSVIDDFYKIKGIPNLVGCNVTIPYKESIIPFLDEVSSEAQSIGAVNTIKVISRGGNTYFNGYNTDKPAFLKTLTPFQGQINGAIILGTGGASKAIKAALKDIRVPYIVVGRNTKVNYELLDEQIMSQHNLIINCTPLGTFPTVNECPNIPYDYLSSNSILYDLVYNPSETLFLSKGKKQGATCINGLQMLKIQADCSLEIWQNSDLGNCGT